VVSPVERAYFVRDSFEISDTALGPRDTSRPTRACTCAGTGKPTIPSTIITGYRYKLDSPRSYLDSSRARDSYNTGVGSTR